MQGVIDDDPSAIGACVLPRDDEEEVAPIRSTGSVSITDKDGFLEV